MITLARPLVYISLSLAGLLLLVLGLVGQLAVYFQENLNVNLLILAVLIFGIGLSYWRLLSLNYEMVWLGNVQRATTSTDADALAGDRARRALFCSVPLLLFGDGFFLPIRL